MLTGQVLICHTSYHRTTFYIIVRETAKCVFVKRVLPVREDISNVSDNLLLGSTRIVGVQQPEENEKEYRLSKKDDGTFSGKADSLSTETYRIWDGQPIIQRYND